MAFIKSKLSGYYFKQFGVWTSDPLDALPFTNEWSARDFVRRKRLEDVQVVEAESTTRDLPVAA
jgi:hypothetical protein